MAKVLVDQEQPVCTPGLIASSGQTSLWSGPQFWGKAPPVSEPRLLELQCLLW